MSARRVKIWNDDLCQACVSARLSLITPTTAPWEDVVQVKEIPVIIVSPIVAYSSRKSKKEALLHKFLTKV